MPGARWQRGQGSLRGEGGAHLVGQGHRHLEPALGERQRGVRLHDEVPHHGSESPHRESEPDRAFSWGDVEMPAAVHDREILVERLRAELALRDARHHDQLLRHRTDEHGELFALGKTGSRIADAAEERGRRRLVAPGPRHAQCKLTGEETDDHERHRRRHIALLGNGELLVGLGVEHGERHCCARHCAEDGCPAASGSRGGHDQNEAHRHDDVAVVRAKGYPQHRHPCRCRASHDECHH
jgi:hypothetical protein